MNMHILNRRVLSRLLAALALASVLVWSFPAPASATNFDWYYADNSDHYYAYVGLESYTITASDWGRSRLDATNLQTYDDGNCTITLFSNGSTDVCVYDHDYTGPAWDGVYGITDCRRVVIGDPQKCDSFRIRYDNSNLSTYSNNWLKRAGCHEWGHTTGLEHFNEVGGDYSCMWSAINYAYQSTYLAGHDTNHINGRY